METHRSSFWILAILARISTTFGMCDPRCAGFGDCCP
uniref:MIP08372p n=1 Tax=Drosophila melanogaster TaxID=7227 RepID=C0PV42_DROME|nr:MIP08372p [Drosophila melanogaster]